MILDINVNVDSEKIRRELEQKARKAQEVLDSAVLSDSNYFIPKDSHTLENSGIDATVIGSGVVVWDAPYAKTQYYGENFDHSKQRNPNACAKWFEAAKARYLKKWETLVNGTIKHQ